MFIFSVNKHQLEPTAWFVEYVALEIYSLNIPYKIFAKYLFSTM